MQLLINEPVSPFDVLWTINKLTGSHTMKKVLSLLLFVLLSINVYSQNDAEGCSDHPLITRYPGAVIEYCNSSQFLEFGIATGPETGYRQISDWIEVEGKHSRIYYSIQGKITTTEVYQNYLSALRSGGFSLLANKLHPERNVSNDIGGNTWLTTFYRTNPFPSNVGIKINQGSGTMGGTFYIAAQKDNVYVTLSGKRYSDQETVVLLDILETEEMKDNLITINADFIADKLFSDGKIALRGILFDFDKATIKEESIPLLEEIAMFLNNHPETEIFVVGHTDMSGEVEYNINLSNRRANSVTEYLVNHHQINPDRLLPHGVGPLAPAAANRTENGREMNRRVELVLKSM